MLPVHSGKHPGISRRECEIIIETGVCSLFLIICKCHTFNAKNASIFQSIFFIVSNDLILFYFVLPKRMCSEKN